jgi:hypothetical protein
MFAVISLTTVLIVIYAIASIKKDLKMMTYLSEMDMSSPESTIQSLSRVVYKHGLDNHKLCRMAARLAIARGYVPASKLSSYYLSDNLTSQALKRLELGLVIEQMLNPEHIIVPPYISLSA